jgi:hypothetical protein
VAIKFGINRNFFEISAQVFLFLAGTFYFCIDFNDLLCTSSKKKLALAHFTLQKSNI